MEKWIFMFLQTRVCKCSLVVNLTCNFPILERAQMFFKKWMNKSAVVGSQGEILPPSGRHTGAGWSSRASCWATKWEWKSLHRVQLFATALPTVHGPLQAGILEWAAFPFSRASSQPRDQTQVSCLAGGFFTSWATRIQAQMLPTVRLHSYEILGVPELQWWTQNKVARG